MLQPKFHKPSASHGQQTPRHDDTRHFIASKMSADAKELSREVAAAERRYAELSAQVSLLLRTCASPTADIQPQLKALRKMLDDHAEEMGLTEWSNQTSQNLATHRKKKA